MKTNLNVNIAKDEYGNELNINLGTIKNIFIGGNSGRCPNCNSRRVKRIVYGYIKISFWRAFLQKKWIGGGCCINPDSPAWYCASCKKEWGRVSE